MTNQPTSVAVRGTTACHSGARSLHLACFLVATVAWGLPHPAHAVFKCQDAAGVTSYQDQPCASASRRLQFVPESTSPAPSAVDPDVAGKLSEAKRDKEMLYAIQRREPAIGMTIQELNMAMGRPDEVNPSNYNGRIRNQLIYNRGQRRLLVYTDDGKVTAIQDRVNHSAPKPLPPGQRCPTSIELQNARNAAKSNTLTDGQRSIKLKEIEKMESCGKK